MISCIRTTLAPSYPNSANLHIPWIHRTPDLSLWAHCFPNLFPCVCDMLQCFTPVNWLGCGGKTFQLNLEIAWHHVNALCCSWNAMEPGWAKACPDKWASILKTDVYWMGWNPVKLHNALNLGNCGPESFSQGISGRAYSCGIALEGCHRTPEDSIALHTHTHRSSYSTKGIVYQKNLRIQQRTILEEKTRRRMARERRGAGSSLVSIETLYYKTIY